MTITYTPADLADLACEWEREAEIYANNARMARPAEQRHRNNEASLISARHAALIRKLIEPAMPRPALRLVSNEGAA